MPHLEEYHDKNSRHECPNCHDKRSFTLYVDDTGQPIDPTCGRCDHENNCGYHYTPRQYYADHPTDRKPITDRPKPKPLPPKPKQLCTIPFDYVRKSASFRSSFVGFLRSIFDIDIVRYLMALYAVGATASGDVIFWQIDKAGRIRAGKIMRYNTTGHRDKRHFGNWVHSILKGKNLLPNEWELSQCLFGEHLLQWSWNKKKTVALVESEKTAIICAAVFPQYIWLATGGKHNLQIEKTNALAGRKVIMYPDTDSTGATFRLWKDKANEMAGFCKVAVSDLLEREATPEQKEKGIDIADWLVDEIKAGSLAVGVTNEMKAVVMAEQSPIVNELIKGLDLIPDA